MDIKMHKKILFQAGFHIRKEKQYLLFAAGIFRRNVIIY